jgi:hypothetical protein
MTEVLKTNVTSRFKAKLILDLFKDIFPGYAVNFDLEDCDHILRIQTPEDVDVEAVISLLDECGFQAELLSDEIPETLPENK